MRRGECQSLFDLSSDQRDWYVNPLLILNARNSVLSLDSTFSSAERFLVGLLFSFVHFICILGDVLLCYTKTHTSLSGNLFPTLKPSCLNSH